VTSVSAQARGRGGNWQGWPRSLAPRAGSTRLLTSAKEGREVQGFVVFAGAMTQRVLTCGILLVSPSSQHDVAATGEVGALPVPMVSTLFDEG
jgi:hypothetical protein